MSNPHYAELAEIERLVSRFEDCTLPCEQWTHAAHLTVGLWFLGRNAPEAALDAMRQGIQRYNVTCGVPETPTRGYHETITRFYMTFMAGYLARANDRSDWLSVTNQLLASHGERDLPLTYYTRERLMSAEARAGWVTPDLRQID